MTVAPEILSPQYPSLAFEADHWGNLFEAERLDEKMRLPSQSDIDIAKQVFGAAVIHAMAGDCYLSDAPAEIFNPRYYGPYTVIKYDVEHLEVRGTQTIESLFTPKFGGQEGFAINCSHRDLIGLSRRSVQTGLIRPGKFIIDKPDAPKGEYWQYRRSAWFGIILNDSAGETELYTFQEVVPTLEGNINVGDFSLLRIIKHRANLNPQASVSYSRKDPKILIENIRELSVVT